MNHRPETLELLKHLATCRDHDAVKAGFRRQWGVRDFDKVTFNLPIPCFDSKFELHREITAVAPKAEKIAANVELPENIKLQRGRGLVRNALLEDGVAGEIEGLVARLLDGEI